VTNVTGASVSFTFYGTAVEIFGSRRRDSGRYQVTLDDKPFEVENATSTISDFRASLFVKKGLSKREHTVVLENREAKNRDIDYVGTATFDNQTRALTQREIKITWEQSVGQDNEPCTVHTIQDSDPMFTYEPANQWTTDPPFVNGYSGGSGQ
jgi:hypothetical protein